MSLRDLLAGEVVIGSPIIYGAEDSRTSQRESVNEPIGKCVKPMFPQLVLETRFVSSSRPGPNAVRNLSTEIAETVPLILAG